MTSLDAHLAARIHPDISPLWVVADADGLFRRDGVARELTARGVDVLPYEDPIAFRYRYEHFIRPRLASARPGCQVIVVEPAAEGLQRLPADILAESRVLEVSLAELFPMLARPVVCELDPESLTALWAKREDFLSVRLGERDTIDLLLRLVYQVEPSQVTSPQELIPTLVELHARGARVTESAARRLRQLAKVNGVLGSGARDSVLIPGAFWRYLQDEWERWLNPPVSGVSMERTGFVPNFDHPRLRAWMDTLFLDGILQPLSPAPATLPRPWCEVGVRRPATAVATRDWPAKRAHVLAELPDEQAGPEAWLRFARRYAAHQAALFSEEASSSDITAFWQEVWVPVDARFSVFARTRLDSLVNLPPVRPVLVSAIPRFLARRTAAGARVALLVLDGLSLAQWMMVRAELLAAHPDWSCQDEACFALAPTLTNVSRQALHAGEPPVLFGPTVERTDADGRRWKGFWDAQPGRPVRAMQMNVLGRETDLDAVRQAVATEPGALALTIRMPDEIVHGATLGWRGVAEQLRLWARQDFLKETIALLLAAGHEVHLTSDHGNVEAVGEGAFAQGVLVEQAGERVRIYRNETVRQHARARLGGRAVPITGSLLPPDYLPLVHTGRGAFVAEGQMVVAHGGLSLDELVVPFVRVSRSPSA